MFNVFKKDERESLRQAINARRRLLEQAMRKHGINSSQAREFDKQIDELEAQLQAA